MVNGLKLILVSAVILFLAGCAGRGPVYLQPAYTKETLPPLMIPEGKSVTVAVALFEDGRAIKDKIGLRRAYRGPAQAIQYGGPSLEEMVTRAMTSQLKRAGFQPQEVSPWDLRRETIPELPQEYILGGRLDSFWAEVDSGLGGTTARFRVELTVALALLKEKRVLWQNTIHSSSEFKELLFSNEKMQDSFSSTFSTAVNRILQNPELQGIVGRK